MQFALVDRILELQPGQRIVTLKNLTLGEEYLQDHFPGFPVMPGVLMLEALVQTGAWLIRATTDYSSSIIVLGAVRTVTYGNFVFPGQQLVMEVRIRQMRDAQVLLNGKGTVGEVRVVSSRFSVEHYNLGDRDPELRDLDERIVAGLKEQFRLLVGSGTGLGGTLQASAESATTS